MSVNLCLSCRWSSMRHIADRLLMLVCVNGWETGRQHCKGYDYEPGSDAYENAYNGLEAVRREQTCQTITTTPRTRQA